MEIAHYDAATPLIPAEHQPAVVAEHLRTLDMSLDRLVVHGLPVPRPGNPAGRSTPAQLLELLRGASRTVRDPELAFQLGRKLLPGHYGAASHALLAAPTLRRALQVLTRHAARLSPLLVPHVVVEGQLAALYWTDACASAGMRAFLVEMHMSAFAATSNWLAGERLPWIYLFNRGEPARRDAHEAHLGTNLRFACHLDAMVIDTDWLDRVWTNPRALHSPAISDALDREAEDQEARRSLTALVYDHLMARVNRQPSLDDTAAAFAMSPATLKRRLAACGTHFQAELDQVRLHTALHLMYRRDMDNDAIGRHLGYDDAANFRRSVKRWAGLTPVQLRARLGIEGVWGVPRLT